MKMMKMHIASLDIPDVFARTLYEITTFEKLKYTFLDKPYF